MTVLDVVQRYITLISMALALLSVVLTSAFVDLFVDLGFFSSNISYGVFGILTLAVYILLDEVVGGILEYYSQKIYEDGEEYNDGGGDGDDENFR